MPAATAVTNPVEASTVAVMGALLDHVPPDVVLVHVAEEPLHKTVVPVIF